MPIEIDFEWQRDEAGYDLVMGDGPTDFDVVDGHPVNPRPTQELRIVRRGGRLVPCPPLNPDLYLVFARSAHDEEGLLEFVKRHGPLSQGGNRRGESAADGIEAAAQMRYLLVQVKGQENPQFSDEIECSDVDILIGNDPLTGKFQIKYHVSSLKDALWIQCAEAVCGGKGFRQCDRCGTLFRTGPGTGRREDSKYCSDTCRISFNSKNRSKKAA